MKCKFCGREMRKVVTPFKRPVKGECLKVKDVEVYRCPGCGATYFPRETIEWCGRKTGERLVEVAKERGYIKDFRKEVVEQLKKDLEEAIRRGDIKKRKDVPFKIFT